MAEVRVYAGLPWWLSGKEYAFNAGDVGWIPGSGRSPGGGNGSPLQHSCLENPMNRGAWRATVHGVTESDTTERPRVHAQPLLCGLALGVSGDPSGPAFFLLRCLCLSCVSPWSPLLWGFPPRGSLDEEWTAEREWEQAPWGESAGASKPPWAPDCTGVGLSLGQAVERPALPPGAAGGQQPLSPGATTAIPPPQALGAPPWDERGGGPGGMAWSPCPGQCR